MFVFYVIYIYFPMLYYYVWYILDTGGEITFRYKFDKNSFFASLKRFEEGDRIGQLIVMPYPEVQLKEVVKLTESERGVGGYGSTGK